MPVRDQLLTDFLTGKGQSLDDLLAEARRSVDRATDLTRTRDEEAYALNTQTPPWTPPPTPGLDAIKRYGKTVLSDTGNLALGLGKMLVTPPMQTAAEMGNDLATDYALGGAKEAGTALTENVTGLPIRQMTSDYRAGNWPELAGHATTAALAAFLFHKAGARGERPGAVAPEGWVPPEPTVFAGKTPLGPDLPPPLTPKYEGRPLRPVRGEIDVPGLSASGTRPVPSELPNTERVPYRPDSTLPATVPPPELDRFMPNRGADWSAEPAAPVQESAPFIPNEQPPAPPVSTRPKLSAPEVQAMMEGRSKFTNRFPNAEPEPGARDRMDRAGIEYRRTQDALTDLTSRRGRTPEERADIGWLNQAARELGSRLSRGVKDIGTSGNTALFSVAAPAAALAIPDDPNSSTDNILRTLLMGAGVAGLGMAAFGHGYAANDPLIAERMAAATKRVSALDRVHADTLRRIDEANRPQLPNEFSQDLTPELRGIPDKVDMGAGVPIPVDQIRELVSTPEGRTKLGAVAQAHQAGSLLFSPLTLGRIFVSNIASALQKGAEMSANERSLAPMGTTLKELLNIPEMWRSAKEAFQNPRTKYTRDATPTSGGIFGLGTRAVGAMDAPFRNAMERAGFSPEDALTVTQQRRPLTDFGRGALDFQQGSTTARLLIPFLKSKINQFETGITEPFQAGYRLLTHEGSPADAVKVGGALGAGAAGYAGSDVLDELPAPLRGLIMAASGLYATPMAMGYAGGKTGDGLLNAYNAMIKELPLASGMSLDPGTQVNRVMPRILNPDYWTGTKREARGLWEKIQAQIPGLAQRLPER